MKKALIFIAFALLPLCAGAKKIVFMPQWTPQSQFAGFYAAYENGYYSDEGLDVEIKHQSLNSTESQITLLQKGSIQIVGLQLLQAIIAKADGNSILNIMQTTQQSGLCCVSRTPVSGWDDLRGKTIAKWKVGFSEYCQIMDIQKNLNINWIPFVSNGMNLYIFGAVDAMLCYSYSELISLDLAIGKTPENQIMRFKDFGYDCPEDGLYVTEEFYKANKEDVQKFVRASKKGWDWVRENKDEALELTMKWVQRAHVVTNLPFQQQMLEEYLKLQINPLTGKVDYAPADPKVFSTVIYKLLEAGYITQAVKYQDFIR